MKDNWKFVSMSQCICAIVICSLAWGVLFLPFSVGTNEGTALAFAKLPLFGDGSFITHTYNAMSGLRRASFPEAILAILGFLLRSSTYVYFIMLLATIGFGIALAVCQSNTVRIVFRVFSIVFASICILLVIAFLAYFVGNIIYYLSEIGLTDFSHHFLTSGYIYDFGIMLVTLGLVFGFFKWVKKPY